MLLRIAVLLGCLIPFGVFAQDVEQVLKSKPVEAGGSMQMQQMFNHSLEGGNRSQPFNYVLSGNLNLTFFGVVHAPFQMLFSNMGNQFSQPTFNQTALHPQYKWLQLHMGRIAINWSPQTVGGHVFQGVATDLTPGKWTLSALYGRFQKAMAAPSDSLAPDVTPAFRRMGYGFRVGHRFKNAHWQATYFKAADDSSSLNPGPFLQLTPQSNHVIGLLTDQVLFKKLILNAAYNVSYLQNDMRINQSPARKQHYKCGLAWQGKVQRWNLTYEYTDPEYRTLGAYYFNNDMENISVGGNVMALKGKLNLSGQAGLQRDNLDNRKNASMRRRVYSLQGQCNTEWEKAACCRVRTPVLPALPIHAHSLIICSQIAQCWPGIPSISGRFQNPGMYSFHCRCPDWANGRSVLTAMDCGSEMPVPPAATVIFTTLGLV
jgi:hypothetical protein